MSAHRIRIPKILVSGAFASIGALVVASIIAMLVATHLPFSPLAKILFFLHLNNNNPEVYRTRYYLSLVTQAEYVDAYIATPFALLVAGLVFGAFGRKRQMTASGIAAAAAPVGLILTIGVILAGWVLSNLSLSLNGDTQMSFTLTDVPAKAFVQTGSELLLGTLFYVVGASIAVLIPSRPRAAAASARVAGPKAV